MLTEDLARLKGLDPATYHTYIDGAAIHGVLLMACDQTAIEAH